MCVTVVAVERLPQRVPKLENNQSGARIGEKEADMICEAKSLVLGE